VVKLESPGQIVFGVADISEALKPRPSYEIVKPIAGGALVTLGAIMSVLAIKYYNGVPSFGPPLHADWVLWVRELYIIAVNRSVLFGFLPRTKLEDELLLLVIGLRSADWLLLDRRTATKHQSLSFCQPVDENHVSDAWIPRAALEFAMHLLEAIEFNKFYNFVFRFTRRPINDHNVDYIKVFVLGVGAHVRPDICHFASVDISYA